MLDSSRWRNQWSRIPLVLAIATVCLPFPAVADLVHLQLGQPTTPIVNGDYVDPYPFKLTVGGNTTDVLLACDDYLTNVYAGQQWDANRYLLGSLNTVAGTTPKFNATNALGYSVQNMYDAAAVLTLDLLMHPANRGIDSYAIWYIFDPKNPPGGIVPGDVALALSTLASVKANAPTWMYSNVYIYTPAPGYTSQEYLGYVSDSGLTLLLLGGALVGIETLRRKLRR